MPITLSSNRLKL